MEGSCFFAPPSAPVRTAAYESMRDEILKQIREAMPLDGVLLGLHGAMMAYGYEDCEGDIVERARHIVGPEVPIALHMDPHCHLTARRLEIADLMVLYKEYPHTDFMQSAEDALTLLLRTIRGEIRPVMSVFDCRMVEMMPTYCEPGRSFVDRMRQIERTENVLSVSLAHGFVPGDAPECGMRVLVVTDEDRPTGERIAIQLGEQVRSGRGTWSHAFLSVDEAIDAAYGGEGVALVADYSDNAGAGAPSDNTSIIRRLLERGCQDACVGPLWDPIAVQLCHAAGVGATFSLRFGGKTGPASGEPIDAQVTVVGLVQSGVQKFGASSVKFGDAAAIRVAGVEISLIAIRTQALGREVFTAVGIDLAAKRFIGVKSSYHFQAEFASLASRVLHCDSGGVFSPDVRKFPYRRISRPLWPLDELPEGRLLGPRNSQVPG